MAPSSRTARRRSLPIAEGRHRQTSRVGSSSRRNHQGLDNTWGRGAVNRSRSGSDPSTFTTWSSLKTIRRAADVPSIDVSRSGGGWGTAPFEATQSIRGESAPGRREPLTAENAPPQNRIARLAENATFSSSPELSDARERQLRRAGYWMAVGIRASRSSKYLLVPCPCRLPQQIRRAPQPPGSAFCFCWLQIFCQRSNRSAAVPDASYPGSRSEVRGSVRREPRI